MTRPRLVTGARLRYDEVREEHVLLIPEGAVRGGGGWVEAVASSLTELFGPAAIRVRLEALERHYAWIDPAGLEYSAPRARAGAARRPVRA